MNQGNAPRASAGGEITTPRDCLACEVGGAPCALCSRQRAALLPPPPPRPLTVPAPPQARPAALPLAPVEIEFSGPPTEPSPTRSTLSGPPPRDALIGATIGADYIVRELVGSGGMGRVYRAEQPRLGRDVAIKLLHPHLLGDERSLARFYIEARAASRLNHPNSVAVIDFGLDPAGAPYLVMEFLPGQHLRALLRKNAPLPPRTAVRIALEVLSALSEAHAKGVVHRDLKPENIFLVPRREGGHLVKVVDFGLARLAGASGVSQPGWAGGTPGYAAPEQWAGEAVDGRADLYSVGAVLFEMLTGQKPFAGDLPRLLLGHLGERPPLPSAVAPDQHLSPVLDEIVRQALEKRPCDRFLSAESMATALYEALDGLDAPRACACCESCGASIQADNRFCGGCGSPRFTLSPASAPRPSDPQPLPDEPLALLLALEKKARDAEASDPSAVIDTCRQGVAAARRACLTTGEELFEQALVSFSSKLGDALARSGRLSEAEGVLREALAYSAVGPQQRSRMLLLLGRVAAGRGSRTRAEACYAEALCLQVRAPDYALLADLHEAHAAVLRDAGSLDDAARALEAASDALCQVPGAGARRAGALLSLGSLLVEAGQPRRALNALRCALNAAVAEGLPALASTCRLTLEELHSRLASSPPQPLPRATSKPPPTERSRTTAKEPLRAAR